MSAIPSFAFQNMDPSQLDDKMDVASSPFRQPDDLDVELDSVREPSIIESLHDDMLDDPVEPVADAASDIMHDEIEDGSPDDDMIDDENTNIAGPRDEDFNMDAFPDEPRVDEDEDILYEDEEDIELAVGQAEQPLDLKAQQGVQQYQEAEAELILDDVEEQPEQEDRHRIGTNETEAENTAEAPDNLRGVAQKSARADVTTTESSAGAGVQPDAQDGEDSSLDQHHAAQDDVIGTSPDHSREAQAHESYVESEAVEQVLETAKATEETEVSDPQEADATTGVQQYGTETLAQDPKDTGKNVHPVTLVYLDEEMSLFPPMIGDESSMYFLADSALAYEPLDKLLAACREVLTGTLDHHDELVLDITSLGLHICEDSKYAAQITLSQVLDVYLQLCRNDGGQETHPLYCHLSSRVSLASQYAYLVSSCAEGRTFSEIAADHIDTPEPEAEHTDAGDHHEAEEIGPSNQEAVAQEHSDEALEEEQSHTAERVVEYQPDEATAEHEDTEGTVVDSSGEAIDAAASEELPQEPPEPADLSEPAIAHETEQTFADDDDEEEHGQEEEGAQTEEHLQAPQTYGTEHEDYPDVRDQLEAQEHETNSSHTVEADRVETEIREGVATEAKAERRDSFDDSFEQAEDLFEHDKDLEQAGEEDFDSYSDEELFAHAAEGQEGTDDAVAPAGHEAESSALQHTDEPNPRSAPNGPDATSEAVDEPISVASPPMTPSKTNHFKRKVDDDDELDLLDLDTPEPKRRRPS